ncbi:MAG: hypothetical protein KQH83_10625 [Actinobacteria bacterium]|nr:hypothetical protein [Actinomycetota bacterium]
MPGEGSPSPESLLGMSAGAVCRVLDDPAGTPLEQVIDAAYEIAYGQGLYRSAWTLAGVGPDGTTVWRSPDGTGSAEVGRDGDVRDLYR